MASKTTFQTSTTIIHSTAFQTTYSIPVSTNPPSTAFHIHSPPTQRAQEISDHMRCIVCKKDTPSEKMYAAHKNCEKVICYLCLSEVPSECPSCRETIADSERPRSPPKITKENKYSIQQTPPPPVSSHVPDPVEAGQQAEDDECECNERATCCGFVLLGIIGSLFYWAIRSNT